MKPSDITVKHVKYFLRFMVLTQALPVGIGILAIIMNQKQTFWDGYEAGWILNLIIFIGVLLAIGVCWIFED